MEVTDIVKSSKSAQPIVTEADAKTAQAAAGLRGDIAGSALSLEKLGIFVTQRNRAIEAIHARILGDYERGGLFMDKLEGWMDRNDAVNHEDPIAQQMHDNKIQSVAASYAKMLEWRTKCALAMAEVIRILQGNAQPKEAKKKAPPNMMQVVVQPGASATVNEKKVESA